MSEQRKTSRSLSEISHLFLSDVRARHTNGAAPPQRKPPGGGSPRADVSIDMTAAEYAAAFGMAADAGEAPIRRPVSAVIATCADTQHPTQHHAYGRHLAAEGQRIGMIEIEPEQVRISCLEPVQMSQAPLSTTEAIQPQRLRETLEELNADVEQWLVSFHHPRSHDARQLLSQIDAWAVLCRCDHDSVVACYRTLKGLIGEKRPELTLALVDAADEAEAGRVFQKLSSVCQQFLNLPLKLGVMIQRQEVAEHVINCAWGAGAGDGAGPWEVVRELLLGSPVQAEPVRTDPVQMDQVRIDPVQVESVHVEPAQVETIRPEPISVMEGTPEMHEPTFMTQAQVNRETREVNAPPQPAQPQAPVPHGFDDVARSAGRDGPSDVIELSTATEGAEGILSAVLQQGGGGLVECPVRPPMCGASRLAVDREHRLVLVAATRRGLEDLRTIGQAYRWLIENRGLVAMAMPQFQIDAHQLPRLRLLVDQRDLSAELLQPMLQSGHVTVESYRKLRWGGRTGLLLEAA